MVKGNEEILSLREEITDRFGPVPVPVDLLLEIMDLKLLAKEVKVLKIDRKDTYVFITLAPTAKLEQSVLTGLMSQYKGKIRFLSEYTFEIQTSNTDWPTTKTEVRECLQRLHHQL